MTNEEIQNLVDEFKTITIAELVLESEREALTLRKFISQQIRAGTDPTELKAVLLRDLKEGGQIFGSFRSQFKATVKNEVENTNRRTINAITYEKGVELLDWTLDPGAEHCDDCLNRSEMQPATMKQWQIIGVPMAGITICGLRCRCRLTPSGIYTNQDVKDADKIYQKEKIK